MDPVVKNKPKNKLKADSDKSYEQIVTFLNEPLRKT